jgi:hypothetical protein
LDKTRECNNLNKFFLSTLSLAGEADGANFQWGCHHQWSFWRVANSKFVVHETTLNNGLILQQNLVTITAFKALLIPVAVVSTVLHLLEVPYHTELAHRCNQMPLLFTIFSDLKANIICETNP